MRVEEERVEDAADPRVREFTQLTDMDLRQRIEPAHGIFIAEGHLVIERAAAAGLSIRSVLTEERWIPRLQFLLSDVDIPVYVASEEILRSITGYRVHRGALASVNRPVTARVDEMLESGADILVLEDLVDPTNVGLAIRSAVVQGIAEIIISPGCADPLYRKAVKSSMGAVLRCRWARSDDWAATLDAVASQRRLVALTPDGDCDLDRALDEAGREPVALAFGSEGPGLTRQAQLMAWRRCRIPMVDEGDSLNVAASVAVAAYARSRSMRG